jgi:hypothetical protein
MPPGFIPFFFPLALPFALRPSQSFRARSAVGKIDKYDVSGSFYSCELYFALCIRARTRTGDFDNPAFKELDDTLSRHFTTRLVPRPDCFLDSIAGANFTIYKLVCVVQYRRQKYAHKPNDLSAASACRANLFSPLTLHINDTQTTRTTLPPSFADARSV